MKRPRDFTVLLGLDDEVEMGFMGLWLEKEGQLVTPSLLL